MTLLLQRDGRIIIRFSTDFDSTSTVAEDLEAAP